MKDIHETMDTMISIVDRNGKYIYINQNAAEMHNLSMNEIIGKSIFELHKEQSAAFYMNQIIKPILTNWKEIHSNGSFNIGSKNLNLDYHCSPIRNKQGELFGILNIANDHTEIQKKMKFAMIEQSINFIRSLSGGLEQTLMEIFSQMCQLDCIDSGGIYIYNEKNQSLDLICHYNLAHDLIRKAKSFDKDTRQFAAVLRGIPQYDHIMNIPQEAKEAYEKLGIHSLAVIPLIHDDRIIGCISLGMQMKEQITVPEKIFIESVAWRISRIIALDDAQIKLDKTNEDLNKNISDLKEKQQMLIQKSKLESLGELSAGMAHEINQPLMVISLSIENIMQKMITSHKNLSLPYLQKKFDSILHNINRIQQIIDNMRIFARDQSSIIFEKINISEVIENSLSMVRAQYRSDGIKLSFAEVDRKLHVIGNLFKLEQVIVNLLSNSRYALNEKDRIVDFSSFQKEIKIQVSQLEKKVFIEVWDNGIGIPEENIDKLFTPFFTTKKEGEGTGLGLPIAYGIVKEMNGDIRVESKPDEFTNVQVILPVC
jgi:PAS domain S-box-containing protein